MGVCRDLVVLLRVCTLSEDDVGAGMGCEVVNMLMGGWTSGAVVETVLSVVSVITWSVLNSWDVLVSSNSSL